jgi:hypothetical protein
LWSRLNGPAETTYQSHVLRGLVEPIIETLLIGGHSVFAVRIRRASNPTTNTTTVAITTIRRALASSAEAPASRTTG